MSNKLNKAYWEQFYAHNELRIKPKIEIRHWVEQYIPSVSKGDNKTCIEIGCFPGSYLTIFGDLGYKLYGIDFCKDLNLLPEFLKNRGYSTGDFWQEDFLGFNHPHKFDIVASFGFIEHFTNWVEILERHISLLNNKGYLIVEVPNFIGPFQHWLHANFDKARFDRHHIPAMDIEKWTDILDKRGLKIIHKGYFGRFRFWITRNEKRAFFTKVFLRSLKLSRGPLKILLPKNNKMYSPFGGIIAQKQ